MVYHSEICFWKKFDIQKIQFRTILFSFKKYFTEKRTWAKTLFIGSNLYLLTVLSTQFNKSPCFFLSNFLRQFNECTETQFHLLKAKHPLGGPKRISIILVASLVCQQAPNLTKFLFSPFLRLRQQQLVFRQLSRFDFLYIQSNVQVNLCQKLLFLHQLTHNMATDCSLNYKFNTW